MAQLKWLGIHPLHLTAGLVMGLATDGLRLGFWALGPCQAAPRAQEAPLGFWALGPCQAAPREQEAPLGPRKTWRVLLSVLPNPLLACKEPPARD